MCNGLETGQCINEWCAACEWPAERPAQLREWLDCVRDLTVADDADIDRIAAAVSTSFLGRKAFKEHVRVLAARVERGEGPYDRPSSKPAAKKKPAPKRAPPKRKAPPPEESSSSESENERPPRRAASKKKAPENERPRRAASKKKKAPAPAKKKKSPAAPKKSPLVYADDDLLLRPTYVAKAAAEMQARPKKTSGRCDRCDGLHKTEDCPHFSKPREEVVVVAASSTRVAAIRTGMTGALEQVVMDDAPGRPPTLLGSTKRAEAEVRIAPKSYPFADRDTALRVAAKNPKKRGSASWDRYERYKTARTVGEFLDAGGTSGDLRHDWARGYVTQASAAPGDDTDDDFDELYSEVAAAAPAPAPADDWGSASFGMSAAAPAPAAAPAAAAADDFTISLGMKTPAPAATVTPPAPPAAHPLTAPAAPPAAAASVAGGSEEDWGTASFGMSAPAPAARVVSAEADDDWGTASFGMSSAAAAPAPAAAAGEDENWQTVCL